MPKTANRLKARPRRKTTAAAGLVLPLHHRLTIVLRRRLIEGFYSATSALPGEHRLAEEFEVSRVTVRRVLDRLRREGLIDRRHGAGTFVSAGAGTAGPQPQMSYFDYIAASSHAYDAALLEFGRVPTPRFILQIDAKFGSSSLKIVRVSYVKRVPYHVLTAFVPYEFADAISRRAIGNKTVLELLEKRGVVPATSELRIGAVAADTFEAQHLKVPVGVPLVRAIRMSRLERGRPIEYNQILSVADLFGYRFFFSERNGTWSLPPVD